MNKKQTWLIGGILFALVSCTDLSQVCRHSMYAGARLFSFVRSNTANAEEDAGMAPSPPVALAPPANKFEPTELHWGVLADVTYRKKWSKEMGMDYMYPVFGEKVKKLQAKDLYITGFIVPIDISGGHYALSQNPYASCFFCGGSGPESIISLKFKYGARHYDTDEYLTIRGTMALNDSNVNDFIYIFKNVEEYNP